VIKPKKKICVVCGEPDYIWSKGRCKSCASKQGKKPTTKRSPIKKLSVKRKLETVQYLKLRLDYLNKYPKCQARLFGCSEWATEIHHKGGRIGSKLTDDSLFLAVCRKCHTFIELNPTFAKENQLSINRI
jgi:hypothetical protein